MSPEEALQHLREVMETRLAHEAGKKQAQERQQRIQAMLQAATGVGAFALLGALDPQGAKRRLLKMAEGIADQYLCGPSAHHAPHSEVPMFRPFPQDNVKDADFTIVEEEEEQE